MNRRQKLVQQQFLNNEEAVISRLQYIYDQSLGEVNAKIKELDFIIGDLKEQYDWADDAEKEIIKSRIQSKIYQKQYQEALHDQLDGILDKMQTKQFLTISDYLDTCYEDGFVGSLFDLHGQNIPLMMPINQESMVRAVQLDSKISQGLYTRLGEDIDVLKKRITSEVTRSIATGTSYAQTAKRLAGQTKIGYNKAVRIARTEGHRIQTTAAMDAAYQAKSRGADILKQWDATLDDVTRESHMMVDGEIRELDEKFSNGLMFPGDPAGGAAKVVNCRCALLQRARWALDEDELKTLQDRAAFFGLDKSEQFNDFKSKYLKAVAEPAPAEQSLKKTGMQRTIDGVYSVDARYSSEEGYLEWRKANMPILKENGIKSNVTAKEEWVKTRMQSQQHSFHVVSKEDAIKTISDSIPDQTMRAWFVSADSDAKPKILEAIMQRDDVWNAGLNVSWMNYVETTGTDISFEEFLTTPIKMYRGTRGQSEIASDVWVSFSFDRKIAESFGDQIEEITIRPIDTWGSYQTTAEGELLVPQMWLRENRKS